MQKPTRGSVKASQARPTKRIMEAGSGSTCHREEAEEDVIHLSPQWGFPQCRSQAIKACSPCIL